MDDDELAEYINSLNKPLNDEHLKIINKLEKDEYVSLNESFNILAAITGISETNIKNRYKNLKFKEKCIGINKNKGVHFL